MYTLLYSLLGINLLLFLVSFFKLRNSQDKIRFTYFKTFIIGAWVWEDVLVISLFHSLIFVLTIVLRDLRVGFLSLLFFWLVRSLGEVTYFTLQQFIQPKFAPHYLHDHFAIMRKLFGDISDQKCFILMQVFFQGILAWTLILLALLVLNWSSIPSSF